MERERVNHRSTRFMLECQHNHQPIPHLFQQTSGVMVPDLSTLLIFFLAWFRGLQLTHVSLHCSCPCLGTLRQSRAGVAAPSSWRREEAVGASGWRRARGQTCSDRYPCPTASRAACFGPGRPGGLVLRSRRRRLCAAAGARDAGCAWLSWRPPAPPPREGAAASGRARDRLSPAAAAAAADPAPGPGASQEEETKTGGRRSAACPDAIRSVAGGESPPNPG